MNPDVIASELLAVRLNSTENENWMFEAFKESKFKLEVEAILIIA